MKSAKYLIVIGILISIHSTVTCKEHPCLFISKKEAAEIKSALGQYPLLDHSFQAHVDMVVEAINTGIEVPMPGEAGGYAHEKHKQNYREMHSAGLLFSITGEERYALFVKNMLMAYAEMYPELGPHPLAHHQAPGKIFHQMLNETVWLVYTVQAYDCIYEWLSPEERSYLEKSIFRPISEWFTVEHKHEFNRIHNHGTWSVASIGMLGYVLENEELIEMALLGTEKDGKGGFLKQLDMLFSPDGYYMEGPYYVRYALRPFFFFAEAIQRNDAERNIFKYRNQILKKAYYAAVQTTFPNGVFPPINDASKTMNVKAPGVVISNDLCYYRFGSDINLLGVAKLQDEVILNAAGLRVAKAYSETSNVPIPEWGSIEFTDGHDGKKGGLGILRTGHGKNQSMLLMKYGVHGGGHGHFDKLHFIFFNQGREIIPDYGFARWINIEPKFGGRYLPENKSYAMQTIAHNTVTVDQVTQNEFNRKEAEAMSGNRHFFDASNPDIQLMSASANDYYDGVNMQRTMILMRDKIFTYPVVIDLYRLTSNEFHQYDYPIHYTGQLINTNIDYIPHDSLQISLGNDYGYQHIWNVAEVKSSGVVCFTWLEGNRYYSLTSTLTSLSDVYFGRTGANDPSFNLRSVPLFIIRTNAKDQLFASVLEPHGYFSEAEEKSDRARSNISKVDIIGHNQDASLIKIEHKNNLVWQILINNSENTEQTAVHQTEIAGKIYRWTGNYLINRIENIKGD